MRLLTGLLLLSLLCAGCGAAASPEVAAVKSNSILRGHIQLALFPNRAGTRSCSVPLGGGMFARRGTRIPALCSTLVHDRTVAFRVRWHGFHEPGLVDCRGPDGVELQCVEGKMWWPIKQRTPDSLTWRFRLGPAKHRVVGMSVTGGFPPWWVVRYRHVTLATFAHYWWGHTRGLRIDRDGRAGEVIDDGCCHLAVSVDLRVSQPRATADGAAATVTVTRIKHLEGSEFKVDDTGTLRVKNGILIEPFTGASYCAPDVGMCGA